MGVVFAIRGSLTARYSNGGAVASTFGNTAPAAATDAGALSGNSIQWAANNNVKVASWPARYNSPNGRAISVLLRIDPGYSGTPAATRGYWSLIAGAGRATNLEISHNNSGNFICQAKNESAVLCMNSASFGAWSPTSGTWYDVVFTWDGTTTASSAKVYVDGTLIGSVTPTAAFTASWTNEYFTEFNLGIGNIGGTLNASKIDEVVIWDSVIDPTSVGLVSGTGSLNGASRTSLVDVAALNGLTYSDPGEANVRLSTAYTYAGVAKTGTAAIPTAANVRSGTATDATTGTLAVPSASNVRLGTSVDNTTGTLDLPAEVDVRSGVQYDNATKTGSYAGGSCDYPAESTVLYGTSYGSGAYTGSYGSGPPSGSWAPQQTQSAIFTLLKDDVTLCTLLGTTQGGTQKVFDFVPDNPTFPYVVMQINPWEDRGHYTGEGLTAILTIHVWYQPGQNSNTGRGDKQVQLIQKRIDELLHKSQIAISGWRNLILRRSLIDILVEPDNVTRHGIQQFKLNLGGT